MKILIKGEKPVPEYPKKFKCIHCGSILEADAYDLKYIGSQYNDSVYEYVCPVCQATRAVYDSDFIKE